MSTHAGGGESPPPLGCLPIALGALMLAAAGVQWLFEGAVTGAGQRCLDGGLILIVVGWLMLAFLGE